MAALLLATMQEQFYKYMSDWSEAITKLLQDRRILAVQYRVELGTVKNKIAKSAISDSLVLQYKAG